MIVLTVNGLIEKLGFSAVSLPKPERNIDGVYIGDLLSWVMGKATNDNVWITIMSNINIVAVASLTDVSCIILAEGVKLSDDVVNTAKQKGINILSSDNNAYKIAVKLSEVI